MQSTWPYVRYTGNHAPDSRHFIIFEICVWFHPHNQTVNICTAADGEVQYEWDTGDTDTVCVFKAEFFVEGDNTTTTFPNDGYFYINIQDDVGTA